MPFLPAMLARLAGSPLVLLLDVDGTLAPIAPRPEAAAVPPETRRVLTALAQLPDVHAVAISGRAAADAARLVSVKGVWTVGNHGFEVAAPGSAPEPQQGVAAFADRMAAAAAQVNELLTAFPGTFVEDKRWTFSVHYRLASGGIAPELVAAVTEVARAAGLRMTLGKSVIEVRPPIDVNKGTAALLIAERLGAFEPRASLLSAGDDVTDEDAFVALRGAGRDFVTVWINGDAVSPDVGTAAEFHVPSPDAFRQLLEAILEQRVAGASRPP